MFAFKPYIECRLRGDTLDGNYSNGLSLTRSATTQAIADGSISNLRSKINQVSCGEAERFSVTVTNTSDAPLTIEMLASFAAKGLHYDKIYRLQSFWSAEGRIKVDTITDLHLIPSWSGGGLRSEKFFNIGSMPVRKYFPLVVLQNSETGECLGVTLSYAGSWQFELLCCQRDYYLTCGLADYDTGHWAKLLNPGEEFTTPEAIVAVGNSFEEVCRKMISAQQPKLSPVDNQMGILFNEYCTTWGVPSHENLHKIINSIAGKGIQFLVIDAGWFKINEEWYDEQGDWNPSKELFPQGLKAVADEIRAAGMIPGLWFELEVAGNGAVSFHNTDHLLKRHGVPLTAGSRRFWDMTDPWVVDYLSGKVIDLLRDCGFGYIKIDYNDTIGIGCDGWESLGEGLRQQVYGTAAFFNRIREQIPGIVIELCSSGGHRLVPQMLELVTQASFSDAHETVYIPIIAANLHRVMLPEQSQIWAVLRASDDIRRIQYSLVNTLLGRMCLSGDIYDLNAEQWEAVDQGMAFYHQAAPIIQHGETILNHCDVENLADPHGNQLVLRQYQGQTLAVAHRFADSKPVDLSFLEGQQVLAVYGNADADFSAQAWIFTSR